MRILIRNTASNPLHLFVSHVGQLKIRQDKQGQGGEDILHGTQGEEPPPTPPSQIVSQWILYGLT